MDQNEGYDCFRQFAESMQDVFFLLEWPGCKPLYITPSFERFWNFKPGEAYHQPDQWLDVVHPDDRARVEHALTGNLSPDGMDIEYRLLRPNGLVNWIQDRWFPITDDTGRARQMIRQVTDITEQKAHEQHVMKYQQQLKALASEMTLAEERLKCQMATQLHDTIGQSLALSKLKLESLVETLSDDEARATLVSTCEIIDQAFTATRSLTCRLSYPVLAVLGLERGIEKWLEDEIAAKHDIQPHFTADPHEKPLDEDLRLVLFRGVRELLNNVIKHARATQVTVSVQRVDERVLITVEDNGAGCDSVEALTKGSSFGLLSIREALKRLGGTLQLDTCPGRGCRAILIAPLALTVTELDSV